MSNQYIDKIITLTCIVVGFLLLILVASQSMDFQKRCDARCGNQPALTPVVDFHEQCLCGEGNGRWRVEVINEAG